MTNIYFGGSGAKALVKPDDLSLMPRNVMEEGDSSLSKLRYHLHKCALKMHTHPTPREMKTSFP